MEETYIKVKGDWKYLYRPVDKAGDTIDFLPRARRNNAAARSFFDKDLRSVRILLSGIELMHMIRKGQMKDGGKEQTPAQLFYSLAV
jgi:transposase-like protein